MSIEKIKELWEVSKVGASPILSAVVEHILEQEEPDLIVEKGQIWRSKDTKKLAEVMMVGCGKPNDLQLINDDGYIFVDSTENLTTNAELVTMDNIKEGEWVESKNDTTLFEIGDKFKVKETEPFFVVHVGINSIAYNKIYFKPCLPPTEKEEKLFTQEDIDKAREEGRVSGYGEGRVHERELQRKYIESNEITKAYIGNRK